MAAWFRVRNAPAPWGDYGRVLISGITGKRDPDGRLEYERVGPYVPQVTIAGVSDVIVSNEFHEDLRESGLRGFDFREVNKKRIVRLDWSHWDRTAKEPLTYPPGGEPENYLERRKHDPALADQLGTLWEVLIRHTVDDPGDADLVRSAASSFSRILASSAAVDWLRLRVADLLAFERL
jgi:hypothetical protein